jgi:hypothetical protein
VSLLPPRRDQKINDRSLLSAIWSALQVHKLRNRPKAAKKPETNDALDAAKWLIPSVTALFVATGYVIRAAHVALLGDDFDSVIPANYPGETGEFLHAIIASFFDIIVAAGDRKQSVFSGLYTQAVIVAILLCICIIPLALPASKRRVWHIAVALLICVITKFLVFDAPLILVEPIVVSHSPQEETARATQENGSGSYRSSSMIKRRSNDILAEIECRHLRPDAHTLRTGAGTPERQAKLLKRCNPNDQSRDEFVLQAVATLSIICLAAAGLKAPTSRLNVLCILSLLYVLTLPYAYGKLMKPTRFQYGAVIFDGKLPDPAKEKLGNEKHAVVLGTGAGGLSFLVMQESRCPMGDVNSKLKLWTISSGNIVAVLEIYRKDVIQWKLVNEADCVAP